MKFLNKKKGNKGEAIAGEFLKKNGWRIIETNFSVKWGEIDIIASKDKTLAFVEVKTKTNDQYGSPEQMVNKGKVMQIHRIANLYLEKNSKLAKKYDTYRIDVVAITLEEEELSNLNYYENVGAEFI